MSQLAGGTLLQAEGLTKYFPVAKSPFSRARHFVHAVDGISFAVPKGGSLGLVGESGSGKTTPAKMVAKLIDPTAGSMVLDGAGGAVDLVGLRGGRLKDFRRQVQMIFQDPYESMNPRRTIYDTVAEPLAVQGVGNTDERRELVIEMLAMVGLTPPATFLFRFPHELSGGQRQRVAIARALILRPSLVVADEPTSMLDVSTRAAIIGLMLDLADEMDIGYLYITHDLAVARYMCDQIAVMYLGKIVEIADTEELLGNPLHPYTQALIGAVPLPDPRIQREEIRIKGSVSSPVDPAPRCRFYDRCPIAAEVCAASDHPPLAEVGTGHRAACYRI